MIKLNILAILLIACQSLFAANYSGEIKTTSLDAGVIKSSDSSKANSIFGPLVLKSSATFENGEFSVGGSTFVVGGGQVIITNTNNTQTALEVNGYTVLGRGIADSWFPFTLDGNAYVSGNEVIIRGDAAAGYPEWVRINAAGNLGIGTTSPSEKLDVIGGIRTSGTGLGIAIGGNPIPTQGISFPSAYKIEDLGSNLSFGKTNDFNIYANGDIGIGGSTAYKFDVAGGGHFTSSMTVGGGYYGDGSNLTGIPTDVQTSLDTKVDLTETSSVTFQNSEFSVGGSTLVVSGGRVAIGTTTINSTQDTLHLSGTAGTTVINIDNDYAGQYSELRFLEQNNSKWRIQRRNTNDFWIYSDNNASTPFSILNSNGNVGINDTSPSYQLDVNGTGRFVGAVTLDNSEFSVGGSTLVVSGGNVGIGTTSPQTTLQIIGNLSLGNVAGTQRALLGTPSWDLSYMALQNGTIAESAANAAIKQNSSGYTSINAAAGTTLGMEISGVNKVLLDSSGNLGIGTTSPSEKLDVIGGIRTSGTGLGIAIGGNPIPTQGISFPSAYKIEDLGSNLSFGKTNDFNIYANGDIGIGGSTAYKLGITGGIFATSSMTAAGNIFIGDNTTTNDKYIYAKNGDANLPALKYDEINNRWRYSNDGITYSDIGSGSSSDITASFITDDFTSQVDGSTSQFTFSANQVLSSVHIIKNGITLKSPDDYSISGSVLTLVTAPAAGTTLLAKYAAADVSATLSAKQDNFVGDGATTLFTLTASPMTDSVNLYYNGVLQLENQEYTLAGAQVTTLFTPTSGSSVTAKYFAGGTVGNDILSSTNTWSGANIHTGTTTFESTVNIAANSSQQYALTIDSNSNSGDGYVMSISTTGNLYNGIYSQLGTGYTMLSNGLLLQWGQVSGVIGTNLSVPFPEPFSTVFTYTATLDAPSGIGWIIRPQSLSTAGFDVWWDYWSTTGSGGSCIIRWFAIGLP